MSVSKMEYTVTQSVFGGFGKSTVCVTVFVKPVTVKIPTDDQELNMTRYVILGHVTDRDPKEIAIVYNPKAGLLVAGWQVDKYARRVGKDLAVKTCLDQIQEKVGSWFGTTHVVMRDPTKDSWDSIES